MQFDEVINLSSMEFSEKLKTDKNAILIDVRTSEEFSSGKIPNSINIDIYSSQFENEINQLDKNKNYYLYCRSGQRSYYAGKLIKSLGFNEVYNLDCGIIGWQYEIEK